ncbi:MAG: hypothetical protein M3O15_03120, partial [Acidobacteriota bacterium]|nr:hypothetical protein [Acidobacteriota bacterium]
MSRFRLRRILLHAAVTLAALLLLAGGVLFYLLGTQSGTRFLFARLGALMPGSFAVGALDGPIESPLTVHNLVYKRPGMEIHVDLLHLEWRLSELLSRRIDVRRFEADGVHVLSTPQPEQKSSPLPDLHLSFNIIVRDARVRGLTFGSPGGQPLVIDSIDLRTRDIQDNVHIDRLTVRSATFDADASGTVRPVGDYPVDLALQWSARPPGAAGVRGGGTATGTLRELKVAQTVTAPFPVRLDAVLEEPLSNLRFDGRLGFTGVNPRRVRQDLPDALASGNVGLRGNLDSFTSQGSVRGSIAPVGGFDLLYRLGRRGGEWRVEQADLTLPGTPTRLSIHGRVRLDAQQLDLTAAAAWQGLAWPPRTTPSTLKSAFGHAELSAKGSVDRFTSEGKVTAALDPVGTVAAVYRLVRQGEAWHIEQADLSVPGTPTRLSASGHLDLHGQQLALDAAVRWRD